MLNPKPRCFVVLNRREKPVAATSTRTSALYLHAAAVVAAVHRAHVRVELERVVGRLPVVRVHAGIPGGGLYRIGK